MKVLISGSTGLIGSALGAALDGQGHEVAALVRPATRSGRPGVAWDPEADVIDRGGLEGFDAVIHLAGENIASRRWSAAQKRRIRGSRVRGTALLANALAGLERKPSVMVCASAAGYFGDRGDEVLSDDAPAGAGFMADATKEWEEASAPASEAGIRVVNMRIGIVLDRYGGMLKRVLPIFRLGLGGRLGAGTQYMSWITLEDTTRAALWVLERGDMSGGLNVASPNPVTNAEFTRALGEALGRPALLAVPKLALRIAQGGLTEAILSSVRMEPGRLVESGFEFRHPRIGDALTWAAARS